MVVSSMAELECLSALYLGSPVSAPLFQVAARATVSSAPGCSVRREISSRVPGSH